MKNAIFHVGILLPFSLLLPSFKAESSQIDFDYNDTTYLICYYYNKVTGQNSWEWAYDGDNYYKVIGKWTAKTLGSPTTTALYRVAGTRSEIENNYRQACTSQNYDPDKEYYEYGVSSHITSYKHQVWFDTSEQSKKSLPFSRMVAFGDSLSDNGNVYNYSKRLFVAGSYFLGRFSNGPVWVEYFTKSYNLELLDMAVSGVTANVPFPFPYTLAPQVSSYFELMSKIPNADISTTLFSILIGANNYVYNLNDNPRSIVNTIQDAMEKLASHGAKYFLIPNMPNVALAPHYLGDIAKQDELKSKISYQNSLLKLAVNSIRQKYPDVLIIEEDLYTKITDVAEHPEKYFIKNTTDKCNLGLPLGEYNPVNICNTPQSYMFWDFIHPTTTIHCDMSEYIKETISKKFALEPYTANFKQCVNSFVYKS